MHPHAGHSIRVTPLVANLEWWVGLGWVRVRDGVWKSRLGFAGVRYKACVRGCVFKVCERSVCERSVC